MKKLSGLIGVPTDHTEFGPRIQLQTSVLQWAPRKYKFMRQSDAADPFHPRNGTWKRRKIALEVLSNSLDIDCDVDNNDLLTISDIRNESTTTFQMTELLYGTMRIANQKMSASSLFPRTDTGKEDRHKMFTFDLDQIENALTFDVPDKRAVPFPFEDLDVEDDNNHDDNNNNNNKGHSDRNSDMDATNMDMDRRHPSASAASPEPHHDDDDDDDEDPYGPRLLESPSNTELLDEAEGQDTVLLQSVTGGGAASSMSSPNNNAAASSSSAASPLTPSSPSNKQLKSSPTLSNKRKIDRVVYTCGNIGLRITFVDESRPPVLLAFRQSDECYIWTGVLRFVLTRHLKWTTFVDPCVGLQLSDMAKVPTQPDDEELVNFMLTVAGQEKVAKDERLPPCDGILALCDRNGGRDPMHPRIRRWLIFVDVEKMHPVPPPQPTPKVVSPNVSLLDVGEGVASIEELNAASPSSSPSRKQLETENPHWIHFVKISRHIPLTVMKKMGYKMFAHESVALKNSITFVTDPFGSRFFLEETRPGRSAKHETETRRLEVYAGSLENRVSWEDWLQLYGARKVLSEEEKAAQERILGEDGDQSSEELLDEEEEFPLEVGLGAAEMNSFREGGSTTSLTNSSFLSVPAAKHTSNPRMRSTSLTRKRYLINPFAWGSARQPTLPSRRGRTSVSQAPPSTSSPQSESLLIGSPTTTQQSPSTANFDDIAQSETLILESPRSGEGASKASSPVIHVVGPFESIPTLTVTCVSPEEDDLMVGQQQESELLDQRQLSVQAPLSFSDDVNKSSFEESPENPRQDSLPRALALREDLLEGDGTEVGIYLQQEPYSPPNPTLDTKEQSYNSMPVVLGAERNISTRLPLATTTTDETNQPERSSDEGLTADAPCASPQQIPRARSLETGPCDPEGGVSRNNNKIPQVPEAEGNSPECPASLTEKIASRATNCDTTTETVTEVPLLVDPKSQADGTPSNASLRFAPSSSSFAFPSNSEETLGGTSVQTSAAPNSLLHPDRGAVWDHDGNLFESAFSLSVVLRSNANSSSLKSKHRKPSQLSESSFGRLPQGSYEEDEDESFRDSFVTSPVLQRRSPVNEHSATPVDVAEARSKPPKKSPMPKKQDSLALRPTSQSLYLCPICGEDKAISERCATTGRRHGAVIVTVNRPASIRTEKISRAAAAILLDLESETL